MTTAAIVVLAVRILFPLTIFRWRIGGSIGSMLLDGVDVILVDALASVFGEDPGLGDHYQSFDKWLDMYYLTIEAFIAIRFSNLLVRNTSIGLYCFRLVGIVAFAITGEKYRKLIFFFPNLFENFFLFAILAERFSPKLLPKNILQLVVVLILLYVPKFFQEWILHYKQLTPWNWFRESILGVKPN